MSASDKFPTRTSLRIACLLAIQEPGNNKSIRIPVTERVVTSRTSQGMDEGKTAHVYFIVLIFMYLHYWKEKKEI